MPLKKLWKRVFNSEIQFQVLKSQSSVELSCYTKKQRQPYSNIRKFNSYYDALEITVDTKPEENNIECSCDDNEDTDQVVSFWHISNGMHHSSGDIDKNYQLRANVNESIEGQHSILKIIGNVHELLPFEKSLLMKSVESESLHPWIFFNVNYEATNIQKENGIGKLKETLLKNNYKCIYGTYKQLHSIKSIRKDRKVVNNEIKNNMGFLIFSYKILNFDAIEQLESQWAQWSGANYLYKCCPKAWNLNKITFYKLTTKPNPWNFVYILLCEFENLMQPENLPIVCETVERLKLRGCGHVGVYKIQQNFIHRCVEEEIFDTKLEARKVENNNDGELASLSSSQWSSQETFKTSNSCA